MATKNYLFFYLNFLSLIHMEMTVPVDPPGKVEIAGVGELLGQVHVGGGHAVLHPQGQQPGQEAH